MSANKFFVSELSQYKKMVRQCITVSVFILVINCLLSTWPCLSLFHSSLELPHFYVTWVDDERKVTETHRGWQLCPASATEHEERAWGCYGWCSGNSPAAFYRETWLSSGQPSSHCWLSTTSCSQAAATSATFCQSQWRTVAYSSSQATTKCPTASPAITEKTQVPSTALVRASSKGGIYAEQGYLKALGGCKLKSLAQHCWTRGLRRVICSYLTFHLLMLCRSWALFHRKWSQRYEYRTPNT